MASPDDGVSADDDPGPVVRPYAVTGGRARPAAGRFDLVCMVTATRATPGPRDGLGPEHLAILQLCAGVISVAEVSAHLDLPVGAVRVLLGDLLVRGLVDVSEPAPQTVTHDRRTLEAVLHGLRAL